MDRIKLGVDISNTSEFHNLSIELWLDKDKFFDSTIAPGKHHVIHEFDGADGDHILKIKLKNKTAEHTQIDEQGNIISDALITVDNVYLDEINIDQLIWSHGEYVHDGNGTEVISVHKFYGDMGCNGHVQLRFSSPVYLWLLENM